MSAYREPAPIPEYVEDACDLLIEDFRPKRIIRGVLRTWLRPGEEIETCLLAIYFGLMLDTATGAALDILGAHVGAARDGSNDSTFRQAIKISIRINRSEGRTIDIYEVALLLSESFRYVEFYPATFQITVDQPVDPALFARAMRRTKASGVGLRVVINTEPESDRVVFGSALHPGVGRGMGTAFSKQPRRVAAHVRTM